jgi:hypothetical protein
MVDRHRNRARALCDCLECCQHRRRDAVCGRRDLLSREGRLDGGEIKAREWRGPTRSSLIREGLCMIDPKPPKYFFRSA